MKASSLPSARAAFTSRALAARIVFSRSTSASAAASSARFFAAVVARASSAAAARAASPMASIAACSSVARVEVVGHVQARLRFQHRAAREPERQLEHVVPGIARLDAFNHAVDPVGPQEFAREAGRVVAPRGLRERAPCARAAGSAAGAGRRRAPSAGAAPRRASTAAAAAARPRPRANATTRAMRAPSPAWIASSSVSRSKRETSVTASRIASSVISPSGSSRRQLLHLLLGGEQVAFDAVGEPLERLHRGALLLPREALGEPVGQLVARDRLRLDHDARGVERRRTTWTSSCCQSSSGSITSVSVSAGSFAH